MPKYGFKCGACNAVTEREAKMSEPIPSAMCTSCMIPMERDYSGDAIGFIPTSGMYSRDSRKS